MQLIADFGKIERAVGFNNARQTLMSMGTLDAPKDASPLLVKHDKGYYLLVLGFEAGNFSAGGVAQGLKERSDVQVIFYRPYFTWDTIDQDRLLAQDEAGALAKVVPPGSALDVDPDVPLERFRKFASRFTVQVKGWEEPGDFHIYQIESRDVLSLFSRGLDETRSIASRLLDSLTSLSGDDKESFLRIMGQAKDLRFEKLNALMEKANLPAVLACSRLNIQELTGMPWDTITEDLVGLYDGKRIFVLSPKELDLPQGRRVGSRGDLNKALGDLLGPSVLGVEEKHMPVGRYQFIKAEKKDAGNILRLWRERQAVFNLPYFVVSVQAARYAMEKALQVLEAKIRGGGSMTEKELGAKVEKFFPEFKEKHRLPLELRESHLAINAGARTPYPALPGNFELNSSSRSVKIDTGVLVFRNHLLYSASDLARTLVFSKEAEEMQGYLDQSMLQIAIPACREGRTGADVHKAGMALLLEKMPRIRELRMVPEGRKLEEVYTRNIGHLLGGKQQPTVIFFTPADKAFQTEEGMIGCVEYQWPIAGHSIGSEDMFLVTKTHGINFTR